MGTMTPELAGSRAAAKVAPAHLVGGIGGLAFVATVIAQNVIRGASAPAFNADAPTVTQFYATHGTSTAVLSALFPLGAVGLALFIGALGSRLAATPFRAPALAGFLGVAGIVATYAMTVATDVALGGYVGRGAADPGVVGALWVTHNAVFGVLLVSIAVALAGLSVAASAAGLVAGAWKAAGTLGAVALLVVGAATPALLDGSGILALGLAGFLVWVVFVVTAAVALLRLRSPGDAR